MQEVGPSGCAKSAGCRFGRFISRLIALGLILPFAGGTFAPGEEMVLADFSKPEAAKAWYSVNDDVMGGISKGSFKLTEEDSLFFFGSISLENNGGFASIRTKRNPADLSQAKGLQIEVKGDGRAYWVNLYGANPIMASSYRAALNPPKDKWTKIFIPFESFKFQAFGVEVDGPDLDYTEVISYGFSIYDKKKGPFELELRSVKAVKELEQDPKKAGAFLDQGNPERVIELAIEKAETVSATGNYFASAAIYELACIALQGMYDVCDKSRTVIAEAVSQASESHYAMDKAWILRHTLEEHLPQFAQREATIADREGQTVRL